MRKGLDSLVHDRLLVRRQGSGTFVADHTPADVLFRFFRVYTEAGERVLPSSRDVRVRTAAATKREAGILDLAAGSAGDPHRAHAARRRDADHTRDDRRGRRHSSRSLGAGGKVPNTLYDLFQHRYGVTVSHAEERIEAVAANKRDARHLGLDAGAPLLKVDRTTFGIGARPIEWRVSLCHLNGLRYIVELR